MLTHGPYHAKRHLRAYGKWEDLCHIYHKYLEPLTTFVLNVKQNGCPLIATITEHTYQ